VGQLFLALPDIFIVLPDDGVFLWGPWGHRFLNKSQFGSLVIDRTLRLVGEPLGTFPAFLRVVLTEDIALILCPSNLGLKAQLPGPVGDRIPGSSRQELHAGSGAAIHIIFQEDILLISRPLTPGLRPLLG